ncbi:MFS transporter [Niveispirillum sp. SYP-B3756]|uniref:MFS transporter n=1 Tax=Niveispirillum sp. SYP-B3756 TaxID=2662178 RepID=UPI001565C0F0
MSETSERHDHKRRQRTIAACFVAQNIGMGLAFGSFGPLLTANEAHFGVDRAQASFGMSALISALGIFSALLGGLMGKLPVRAMMMAGAILNGIGYAGLSLGADYGVAIAMFALIGAGTSLIAVLGPVTLATRWVAVGRGKVLSIINLPLVLFATPFLVALLLPAWGREAIYHGFATASFALLLPLLLVSERPTESDSQAAAGRMATPTIRFFRRGDFWLLALGIGILAGIGTAYTVHAVPYAVSRDLSQAQAAGLLSLYAGAGIFGTLLFGWLSDKLGASMALVLAAFTQTIMWLLLVLAPTAIFPIIAAILGIVTVPLVTLHGAVLAALFGPAGVSKAMGYSYAIKLPFIFGVTPLIGWLFMLDGHYQPAFLGCAAALLAATLLFLVVVRWAKARPVATASLNR